MASDAVPSTKIETTLYDLISVICEELESDEEELILPIVVNLLNSGRIKFIDGPRQYKINCT